jgi:hypothetical protein
MQDNNNSCKVVWIAHIVYIDETMNILNYKE